VTDTVATQIFIGIAVVFILLKLMVSTATFFGGSASAVKKGRVRKKLELPNLWFYSVPIGSLMTIPVFKFVSGRKGHILLIEEWGQKEYWLVSEPYFLSTEINGYYITREGDLPIILKTEQTS